MLFLYGSSSFSQERFNVPILDSLLDNGMQIKETSYGYEVASIKSWTGLFKTYIYQLDFNGNVLSSDTASMYEELNAGPYKFLDSYMISGEKDSSSSITSYPKPYLIKLDENLDTVWTYHATNFPYKANFLNPVYLGGDKFIIGGTYQISSSRADMFIMKMDTNGNLIWRQDYNLGSGYTQMLNIDTTSDGGFYLAGGTSSFGNGVGQALYDVYLRKVDSLGNFEWHNWWGGIEGELGFCMSLSNSDCFVYGAKVSIGKSNQLLVKVDLQGNEIWDTIIAFSTVNSDSPSKVIELNDGSIVIAGFVIKTASSFPIGLLYKLGPNNNLIWSRTYSLRTYDHYFRDIIQTSDGGFALTGFVFGDTGVTQDIWVVKVDSMGCDVPLCYLGERELGLELAVLKTYPNPTTTISTLELPKNSKELQLYNSNGQLLKTYRIANNTFQYQLDLTNYQHGIYIVKLLSDKGVPIGQAKVIKR